jgi:tetratricopeptide (TPR) repeat protein
MEIRRAINHKKVYESTTNSVETVELTSPGLPALEESISVKPLSANSERKKTQRKASAKDREATLILVPAMALLLLCVFGIIYVVYVGKQPAPTRIADVTGHKPESLSYYDQIITEAAESIHALKDRTSHLATPDDLDQSTLPTAQLRQTTRQMMAESLRSPPDDSIDRIVSPFVTRMNAFDFYEAGIRLVRESEATHNPLLSQKQWNQAMELFDESIACDPTYFAPHIVLGCMHLHGGNDHEKAIKSIDIALQLDPHNAAAYFHRADVLYDQGDNQKALFDLNTAIECDSRFGPAYKRRAEIREQQGNVVESVIDAALADSYGGFGDDWTYPWTIRELSYTCVESDWTLRYSSDWYASRMQLQEQPSTFRLIRKLNGHRVIAALTTLSSTGCKFDVVAPDMIANAERELLQEQVSDATFDVVASGVATISSCRVPWYDIIVRRSLRDSEWNRFYWLQSGQFVCKIHLATYSEPAHVKATIKLFESVLNSINVKPQ